MRILLSLVPIVAIAGCAESPKPSTIADAEWNSPPPATAATATYDQAFEALMPAVMSTMSAQHYRVAVVEPNINHTRFVVVSDDGGQPLVVRMARYHGPEQVRFSTCLGPCRTSIAVSAVNDDQPAAHAHAQQLLAAITDNISTIKAAR